MLQVVNHSCPDTVDERVINMNPGSVYTQVPRLFCTYLDRSVPKYNYLYRFLPEYNYLYRSLPKYNYLYRSVPKYNFLDRSVP